MKTTGYFRASYICGACLCGLSISSAVAACTSRQVPEARRAGALAGLATPHTGHRKAATAPARVERRAPPKPAAGASAAAPPGAPAGASSAAQGASACPAGMQLIVGEYCSEVEQTCQKSWYDPNNKKKVCEIFSQPSQCVGERSAKRYCIDRYEWPNQPGERPEVMNNFYQAQVKCAAAGKRMCTESEWTLACEGPTLKPYPYGYVRDANKCNGDRAWDRPVMSKVGKRDPAELARLWQGVRSGSQPECVSDFGVHDLPGNADEVVASENFSSTWRGKFDSVTTGGPWYRGVRNQCRPKIYSHDEGFYYYYLGFRCCAEADGRATDPRTPKQVKAGVSFGYVERMARFDVAEMQEKLRLKASGKCSCQEHDTLCKTMCGTLLGEGATDAPPRPPAAAHPSNEHQSNEHQSNETGM